MTIQHISVGDTSTINKINQAIDKANQVDSKASTSDLNTLSVTLSGQISTVSETSSSAIDAVEAALALETDAREIGMSARPLYSETVVPIRPGDAIHYFTSALDGDPADVARLTVSSAVSSANGKVARLDGSLMQIAPIGIWRVEPGRLMRIRFVVTRAQNTDDPSGDAVRLGVRWLSSAKSGVSTFVFADLLNVTTDSGRLEYVFTVATVDSAGVDTVAPLNAVYFRPFIKVFGSGITYAEVIEVVDATAGIMWSPDVSSFRNELAGVAAAVDDVSGQLSMRSTIDIGDTAGAPAARLLGENRYFAIIPSNLLDGFDGTKRIYIDAENPNSIWTIEKGLAVIGPLSGGASALSSLAVENDGTINGDLSVAGASTLTDVLVSGSATIGGSLSDVVIKGVALSAYSAGLFANSDQAAWRTALDVYNKAYVDGLIAAQDAMVFKGVVDCSSNPNYPAASRGWTYRVSVAGKIGGASGINVEAGDILICLTDGTASGNQATVGSSWSTIQTNIDGALTTANIGATVQAYSAELAAIAALTGTTFGRSLLTLANAAALRAVLNTQATIATDADVTLTVGTNAERIRHTGTLTADRSVTLATAGAVAGAIFRITRTGTGSFSLNVGTGPLKALATNTWAEFVYDGSAWYLAAYGAL